MRHGKRSTKLSMMSSHRKATLNNMVRSLLKYQKIETLLDRAKEARRLAEHLITISMEDTVHSRRMAYSVLTDRDLVGKLFKEIGPLFKGRKGGYTRIIPLGFRRGDGASLAILELTEKSITEKLPKKKKEKAREEGAKEGSYKHPEAQAKGHAKAEDKDPSLEEARPVEEHRKEPKKISKARPTLQEEKRAERAKSEDKKIEDKKKFMKNLRGFFHRKTDM